uniref:Angiotensin II receptor-associated protein n=1 Tax=Oryzias latipes TaxID=8090 RepID=A0A3P9KQD8_ORYLA
MPFRHKSVSIHRDYRSGGGADAPQCRRLTLRLLPLLQAIVLVHWLLTVWACMAWPSLSFMWGNFSVLAVGVWAIAQRDSVDAVLMFLVGITVTILTDIIHFGVYFSPGLFDSSVFRFSAGMAILNLLLKPVSCFFVYQMYRERGGEYSVNFGFPSVSRNREAYQSIDQQDESSSPPNPFNQAQDTTRPGVRTY